MTARQTLLVRFTRHNWFTHRIVLVPFEAVSDVREVHRSLDEVEVPGGSIFPGKYCGEGVVPISPPHLNELRDQRLDGSL